MKIACVLAVAVVTAVSLSTATPALASDSNGVTIYCGVEGYAKVSIKADNKNAYPMTCNAVCRIKNGKGEPVEVRVTDKTVAGPDSSYQTLLEQNMTEGPYSGFELDYSCTKA
jgi:hypothetical protein